MKVKAAILILASLIAFEASGQSVPRFLFTPIVRPYDYRPVVGGPPENQYKWENNGSLRTTGINAFQTSATYTQTDPVTGVRINKFTFPGTPDGNQTIGSWNNRRITRWATTAPGESTLKNPPLNPNLKLKGDLNGSIQIYAAPQRAMIDDTNASASYLIPPNITGGTVQVRNQYQPYAVTTYGVAPVGAGGVSAAPPWPGQDFTDGYAGTGGLDPTWARNVTTRSTQASQGPGSTDVRNQWTTAIFWYDFNIVAPNRGGLSGGTRFSLAGLPGGTFTASGTVAVRGQLTAANFGAAAVTLPTQIVLGQCLVVTRTEGSSTFQYPNPNGNGNLTGRNYHWFGNGFTINISTATITASGGNDGSSSLAIYNRNNLFTQSRFFSDFIITAGTLDSNQQNGNNAGSFTQNPTLNIFSSRNVGVMLQYGDLRLKMRQMMRLPQLGPEYLFLNLQNPSLGPARPNIIQ
jgi:hypothetical protein